MCDEADYDEGCDDDFEDGFLLFCFVYGGVVLFEVVAVCGW